MTDIQRNVRNDPVYAQRTSVVEPHSDRPWPMVALAVACVVAVIAGSLGALVTFLVALRLTASDF
jgi:hypothetical protein